MKRRAERATYYLQLGCSSGSSSSNSSTNSPTTLSESYVLKNNCVYSSFEMYVCN